MPEPSTPRPSAPAPADPEPPSAADNVRRWDGATPGRYEVWYLTFNHVATQTGFWIRYTIDAPFPDHGEPFAQVWFARSDAKDPSRTFGVNRRFPIASTNCAARPFEVAIAGNVLEHGRARGALAGHGHDVRWDLRWTPCAESFRWLPEIMYARGGLGSGTVLSPSISAPLSGTVTVDGETYALAGERVGQTHIWAKQHAHGWGWGHCAGFDGDPDAWFEILAPRLRRRGVTLPALTVAALHVGGETFAWNHFRDMPFARNDWSTARYQFRAANLTTRVEGEFSCRPDDMVTAHYVDPDGTPSYCANTTVADLRVTLFRRAGARWREAAHLVAPRRGHFEILSAERDPGVVKDHVALD